MLRALATQLANHGRRVFQGILQRGEQGIKANPRNKDVARFGPEQQRSDAPNARFFLRVDANSRLGHSTWVQRLTGSTTKNMTQNLRSKVGDISRGAFGRNQELTTGRRLISLYALVGLSMKAGSQKIELEDRQFDHICEEIKSLMNPASKHEEGDPVSQDIQLCNLQLGPLIAQGSNSAVYSARLCSIDSEMDNLDGDLEEIDEEFSDYAIVSDEDLSDIEQEWRTRSDISVWDNEWEELETQDKDGGSEKIEKDLATMDLAVKMMFNYSTESDSDAILRAMENEMVPAKHANDSSTESERPNRHKDKKKKLDPHPNVIDIKQVFVDKMPDLEDALSLYPAALPKRLNPEGFGHNKTMFLIMKRYDMTLQDYLERHTPDLGDSLFLLGQLLEAMVHLNQQQVAHRDLKSNNILINESSLDLVVSDFGCCVADKEYGMRIPFYYSEIDKGGNAALRAPEIACAEAGYGCYLDYSRSDLWTVGTLAYEIFGMGNPFYSNASRRRLDSRTYTTEDLPDLPDHVPSLISRFIKSMLSRNPKERPSPEEAANFIHFYLWAPEDWMLPENKPNKLDLTRWLLLETAGVMCHRSWVIQATPSLSLKQCFLSRCSMEGLLDAFDIIRRLN